MLCLLVRKLGEKSILNYQKFSDRSLGKTFWFTDFMDVKFAPKSANGDKDSEITSLLVGIIKVLEPFVEGENKRPVEKTLARSLYGAFLNALKRMKERNLNFD